MTASLSVVSSCPCFLSVRSKQVGALRLSLSTFFIVAEQSGEFAHFVLTSDFLFEFGRAKTVNLHLRCLVYQDRRAHESFALVLEQVGQS